MKNNCRFDEKVKEVIVDSDKYELITTRDGTSTLKINEDGQFYLHSRYNPIKEAEKFADEYYDDEIKNYVIYGLGFAYHIKALLEKDESIHINIIESNMNILKLALDNIDLSFITNNPNVNIYLGDTLDGFRDVFHKVMKLPNSRLILHSPSIKAIPSAMKELRFLLEEFKVREKSINNTNYELDDNFSYNKDNYDEVVNVLFNSFSSRPIFLISAGPSLDKNKDILSSVGDRGIIISVGRAVKSLISVGVKPDFIVITDAQDFVYSSQLEGLNIDIPIIILSTCDRNVMKNYKGKRYIAFQGGYEKSEAYANKLGVELVETGGSVATIGLDIAIRMGGTPIVFVGQDLAFTGGQTHSKGAKAKEIKDTANLRKVEDVFGEEIYTSKNLSIYRRWIENRIRQEKDKEFLDATEGGAKIEGTKVIKLKDVIDSLKCR